MLTLQLVQSRYDRGQTLTRIWRGALSGALIKRKKDEAEQEIVLRLLEHVERHDVVSQDGFAKQIGIAKGLANAYFNRCLQKGWIKLRQVPKQRFLYYLTPKGFAEKARLIPACLKADSLGIPADGER